MGILENLTELSSTAITGIGDILVAIIDGFGSLIETSSDLLGSSK